MTIQRFATSILLAFMLSPLSVNAADPSSSTSVKPLTSPTIATPTTLTVTTDLANKDYSQFSECPKTTLCPDINGRWPAGGKAGLNGTCPNYCIVNSVIQSHQTGGVTIIDSYTPAICPKEFVKIDSFNVQKEVKFNPNPPEAPFPIPDMNTYNAYLTANYTCGVNWAEPEGISTSCQWSDTVPNNGKYVAGLISPLPYGEIGQISAGGQTGVGLFFNWVSKSGCYHRTGKGCESWLTGCDETKMETSSTNVAFFVTNGAAFTTTVYQPYRFIHCTPKGGFYYTANQAPASAVCSSHQARWKLQSN